MKLTGICLLSKDVARLGDFYRTVLQCEPRSQDAVYVEFVQGDVIFSIYSLQAYEDLAPGSTADIGAGSTSLEFDVADPDADYARLLAMGARILKSPANFPWGLRAFWFADPDGNRVSFHAPVK